MPEYNISDLIDVPLSQAFQDSFSRFTGISAAITDSEGACITRTSGYNHLCSDTLRVTDENVSECMKLYVDGAKKSFAANKPFISNCYKGLYYIIAPITLKDQLIGSFVCGQILCTDEKNSSCFEDDESIKRMTYAEIEHAAEYVFATAKLISASAYKKYILIKSNSLRSTSFYSKAKRLPTDFGNERIYNIHELTSSIKAGIILLCKKFNITPQISILSKVPNELLGNPNAIQHVIEGLVSFLVPYSTSSNIEIEFSCEKIYYSYTLVMNIAIQSEHMTEAYLSDIWNSFELNEDEEPEGASLITYIINNMLNGNISISLSENSTITSRLSIPQLDLKVKNNEQH